MKERNTLAVILAVLLILGSILLGLACTKPVKLFNEVSDTIIGAYGVEYAKVMIAAVIAAQCCAMLTLFGFVAYLQYKLQILESSSDEPILQEDSKEETEEIPDFD